MLLGVIAPIDDCLEKMLSNNAPFFANGEDCCCEYLSSFDVYLLSIFYDDGLYVLEEVEGLGGDAVVIVLLCDDNHLILCAFLLFNLSNLLCFGGSEQIPVWTDDALLVYFQF
jgi:hypothetical protein